MRRLSGGTLDTLDTLVVGKGNGHLVVSGGQQFVLTPAQPLEVPPVSLEIRR
ncbi:MAG TPA: hypothetical protein VEJ84_19740 [Acidimicrobiales bacterium]|nr:hypothetical protein [Acidimicrobiales bacterium]